MRKFFRGICGVLATLLTLCILLMAAGLMGVRAFGITPYVVPADMEGLPWSAGALLYVRQEQPETLQPGDTIAYVTDSDLSLEGGVIGSVDAERRFFYVEGTPVYWDNVLGQPLWGVDGLGYVSGYISQPPGLYLVLGAAVVLALLCIFPLRRRKGEKIEESPTGRRAAANVSADAPTEPKQAAAIEERTPTLPEKPAEAVRPVTEVSQPVTVETARPVTEEMPQPAAVEAPKPAEVGRRAVREEASAAKRVAGRRQAPGKRDEAVARHGGKRLQR